MHARGALSWSCSAACIVYWGHYGKRLWLMSSLFLELSLSGPECHVRDAMGILDLGIVITGVAVIGSSCGL
jgi:hypothetical protein